MTLFLLFLKRYVFSFRKNSYITLFIVFSVFMMLVGVCSLLLTQAFMDGAQDMIRSYHLTRTPHLQIQRPGDVKIDPGFVDRIRKEKGVLEVVTEWRNNAWLQGQTLQQLNLTAREDVDQPVLAGRAAMRAGLGPGDPLRLLLPSVSLTPVGLMPQKILISDYRIGESSGAEEGLLVPFDWVKVNIDPKAQPARIIVTCDPPETALSLKQTLEGELPETWILKTYQDLNRPLFYALSLEKWLMFLGVAFILLVAAMQMATSLRLVVLHHQDTFVIMRLYGLNRATLYSYLLSVGLCLGIVGAAGGALAAWGIATLVSHSDLLALPEGIAFLGSVPLSVHPLTALAIAVVALALSLMASVPAVRSALNIRSVEILHAP